MKKLLVIAGLLLMLNSCYEDKYDKLYPNPPVNTCDTTTITYNHDIVPILNASCIINSNCHLGSGSISGIDLTTYAGVQPQATYDILINDINGTPTSRHHTMPKDLPKLPDCEINKITRWVNQGAQNN